MDLAKRSELRRGPALARGRHCRRTANLAGVVFRASLPRRQLSLAFPRQEQEPFAKMVRHEDLRQSRKSTSVLPAKYGLNRLPTNADTLVRLAVDPVQSTAS